LSAGHSTPSQSSINSSESRQSIGPARNSSSFVTLLTMENGFDFNLSTHPPGAADTTGCVRSRTTKLSFALRLPIRRFGAENRPAQEDLAVFPLSELRADRPQRVTGWFQHSQRISRNQNLPYSFLSAFSSAASGQCRNLRGAWCLGGDVTFQVRQFPFFSFLIGGVFGMFSRSATQLLTPLGPIAQRLEQATHNRN
jgi:hypothetical protein